MDLALPVNIGVNITAAPGNRSITRWRAEPETSEPGIRKPGNTGERGEATANTGGPCRSTFRAVRASTGTGAVNTPGSGNQGATANAEPGAGAGNHHQAGERAGERGHKHPNHQETEANTAPETTTGEPGPLPAPGERGRSNKTASRELVSAPEGQHRAWEYRPQECI